MELFQPKDIEKTNAQVMELVDSDGAITLPLEGSFRVSSLGPTGNDLYLHIHDRMQVYSTLILDLKSLTHNRTVLYCRMMPRKRIGNVIEMFPDRFHPDQYTDHPNVMRLIKDGVRKREKGRIKAGCYKHDVFLRIPK